MKLYYAGFFDGEGCISSGYNAQTPRGRLYLGVTVYQKDRRPLDRLQADYGGFITRTGDLWRWQLARQEDQIRFLTDIEPHLIVKQDQARYALRYLAAQALPRGPEAEAVRTTLMKMKVVA